MPYPYYPNYFQPQANQIPQMPNQTPQGRSDFVVVRSEEEARNYPVAFGNTVTFKHESEPYMYTKTMGVSQLDRPIFERYKLIKEQIQEKPIEPQKADSGSIDKIQNEIKSLWKEIDNLKKKNNPRKPNEEETK